jgi:hypothetical protein
VVVLVVVVVIVVVTLVVNVMDVVDVVDVEEAVGSGVTVVTFGPSPRLCRSLANRVSTPTFLFSSAADSEVDGSVDDLEMAQIAACTSGGGVCGGHL